MTNLKLLIADNHESVRNGLRLISMNQTGWEVVAEATTGRQAVEKAKLAKPDITILDLNMPELNGLEATRQILKHDPTCKILVLTAHETDSLVREVRVSGARGQLLKADIGRDLVVAVEAIRRNRTYFTARARQTENQQESLTIRQKEVVQLLAEGLSSKEVAVSLNVSLKTAETHRANIMRRLDCHSVTSLVLYAVRNNMVQP